jgi:hypothetical protein
MMHPEERREAWIRRRAEWWANRRLGRSSEDVWDVREYDFKRHGSKEFTEEISQQGTFTQFPKPYHGGSYAKSRKIWNTDLIVSNLTLPTTGLLNRCVFSVGCPTAELTRYSNSAGQKYDASSRSAIKV